MQRQFTPKKGLLDTNCNIKFAQSGTISLKRNYS